MLITAKLPMLTPFSCIIDGIQASTQCNVRNQKLKIENSKRQIAVYFAFQNSKQKLKTSVNPKIVEDLMKKILEGASNGELAWKIAYMPESQLFTIETR